MSGAIMTLDVVWDGVPLATGATAREQDGGWLVELEQPMPVGTSLVLTGDVQATVVVARVHEGAGAAMLVKRAVSQAPAAAPAATADGEEPTDGGKKERRKKKR